MSKKKNKQKSNQNPAGTAAKAAAPAGAVKNAKAPNAGGSDTVSASPPKNQESFVLDENGEIRRPDLSGEAPRERHEEYVSIADLALAEDELQRAKEEAGIVEKGPWWKQLINRYYDWKDHRTRHLVNKKVYLILSLLLGWCGIHRFYERRWLLGLFYLAFFWTFFPIFLCFTDFLIVLPMKADENGKVLI